MEDPVKRLEERVAWLQKHVVEQDKAMLELSESIERLRREFIEFRDRQAPADAGPASPGAELPHERPPHY